MNICIVLEALATDSLLQELAETLGAAPLRPRSLVWSMLGGGDEVRVWMSLETEPPQLETLMAALRRIPAVRRVVCDDRRKDSDPSPPRPGVQRVPAEHESPRFTD